MEELDIIEDKMIEDIETVNDLLDYLYVDISKAIRNKQNIEEVFEKYNQLLVWQYDEDDCSEIASNIIITPLKKKLWETYERDLFRMEESINKLGAETRCGNDRFRPIRKICDDIAKVYGCEIED